METALASNERMGGERMLFPQIRQGMPACGARSNMSADGHVSLRFATR